ncbi:metalloregulator ArsR/SmtB family transcription factor [Malonomonas rubra]|uniref:ArsR/SmtB family transcription factor n=1 Tax=Malonomonas rubra TaxID=57040 RepID=UPI0026ED8C28|nr:metalloregulator ArsR/SmtB family transcription factor [Malonomonas rubra]
MLFLFKALADQTRLRLLAILQLGEFTVQELVDILQMGQSRISRHLKVLLDAGVVQVKREGTWAYYQLQPTNGLFLDLLPHLEKRWSGLAEYARDRTALVKILSARRQRSREFFDRHARQWDQMARDLLPTADYLSQLLVLIPDCVKLLEVGVGTGSLMAAVADRAERLVGVDHSPSMLEAAREATAVFSHIELKLGQMEALPQESDSVDVVLLNMVLHHASDPAAVIRELARVLHSGGRLLLCDLQRHDKEWVRDELADQWLGFTVQDLSVWCSEAGFEQVVTEIIGGRTDEWPVVILTAIKETH